MRWAGDVEIRPAATGTQRRRTGVVDLEKTPMSIGSFSEVKKNSGMLHIQASAEDLKAFADLAILVPKAAAKAQRRAINKTLGWLLAFDEDAKAAMPYI